MHYGAVFLNDKIYFYFYFFIESYIFADNYSDKPEDVLSTRFEQEYIGLCTCVVNLSRLYGMNQEHVHVHVKGARYWGSTNMPADYLAKFNKIRDLGNGISNFKCIEDSDKFKENHINDHKQMKKIVKEYGETTLTLKNFVEAALKLKVDCKPEGRLLKPPRSISCCHGYVFKNAEKDKAYQEQKESLACWEKEEKSYTSLCNKLRQTTLLGMNRKDRTDKVSVNNKNSLTTFAKDLRLTIISRYRLEDPLQYTTGIEELLQQSGSDLSPRDKSSSL